MSQTKTKKGWYWLLLIPYIAMGWIGSYNRVEPTLYGMPFFYWYQLLWVVLSSVIIAIVFKLAHRASPSADQQAGDKP